MSNDLISRSALMQFLRNNVLVDLTSNLEQAIEEQPTAYDVDKVVEKVESRKRILEVAKIPKAAKAAASNAFMMSLEDIKSGGIEQKKKDKKKC